MEIRTTAGDFSESFKMYIVDEIEARRLSQSQANRKYNILGHSTVSKWLCKYGSVKYGRQPGRTATMNKESHEMLQLQNEIRTLKNELDDARLKNVVLETFVDIAEKELGIPIRKKYGAKQSERSK
jgi:transposase-like protein